MIRHLCGTCRFAEIVDYGRSYDGSPWPAADAIECRRFPPVRLTMVQAAFPRISRSDWCGEWQVNEDQIEEKRTG